LAAIAVIMPIPRELNMNIEFITTP
jgi:hypothetical protein